MPRRAFTLEAFCVSILLHRHTGYPAHRETEMRLENGDNARLKADEADHQVNQNNIVCGKPYAVQLLAFAWGDHRR